MKWTKRGAIVLALCSLLCTTVAFAAPNIPDNLYRGSKLIGADVENTQGENLGDIKDVVFNSRGQLEYAVLGFGGFLGMGEKYFAVPWAALKTVAGQKPGDREHYVLNMDKERLKNAPGFDKNNWPNMADRSWADQVYAFYGVTPSSEAREAVLSGSTTTAETRSTNTVSATIQHVDPNSNRIRMRTANDETVELQAPAGLLGRLQDGDRVEVVIRKSEPAR